MYAIYAYIGPRNHPWPDRQSYGSPRQVVAGHWKVHPAVGSTMFLFRLVSRFSMFLVGLGHNRHGRLAIIGCQQLADALRIQAFTTYQLLPLVTWIPHDFITGLTRGTPTGSARYSQRGISMSCLGKAQIHLWLKAPPRFLLATCCSPMAFLGSKGSRPGTSFLDAVPGTPAGGICSRGSRST